MKGITVQLMAVALSVGCLAHLATAEKQEFAAGFGTPAVQPEVAKQGTRIVVTVPLKTQASWQFRAWRVFAYRPYVPTACIDNGQWPLSESRHGREWDSLAIKDWTWLPKDENPGTLELSLDTSGWAPGDYGLKIAGLFLQGKTDRYANASFTLSILPAEN